MLWQTFSRFILLHLTFKLKQQKDNCKLQICAQGHGSGSCNPASSHKQKHSLVTHFVSLLVPSGILSTVLAAIVIRLRVCRGNLYLITSFCCRVFVRMDTEIGFVTSEIAN